MKLKTNLNLIAQVTSTGILTVGLIFMYSGFLNTVPRSVQASIFLAEQMFVEINDIRHQYHLPALNNNLELQEAARLKTVDMIDNKYFAHISPTDRKWSDFIKDQGYNYTYAGENLAKDYNNSQEIISAWLESPTHKENILNPEYVDTGIAVNFDHSDLSPRVLVAQEFGKKL